MRSLISPNCFILFIWFLSKIVIIMTPAIARAMSITRIETTIIPKDNFDAVSGGEDPDALGNGYTANEVGLKILLRW
jgi:hypothetical protein